MAPAAGLVGGKSSEVTAAWPCAVPRGIQAAKSKLGKRTPKWFFDTKSTAAGFLIVDLQEMSTEEKFEKIDSPANMKLKLQTSMTQKKRETLAARRLVFVDAD